MELALARDLGACKVLKQHFEHASRVIGGMMEKAEGGKPATLTAKKPKAAVRAKAKPPAKRITRVA
jgi:GntR family transcriptional regulator, carbon starvation induced regulator